LALKLNNKFTPLVTSKCRYFIVTGGRGSAKSFSTSTVLTGLTFEKGHRILFTRYTLTSAHLSIIPEFIEKIDLMDLQSNFNITNKDIINNLTGNEILFRGIKTSSGNQTANLKSLQGITTWVNDESEELVDEDTFDTIDLSIRQKGIQNRIILILNPTTKEHWIYKRFFQNNGVKEGFNGEKNDVCYIHTTYEDNIENLSKSFLDQIERIRENNPQKYKHKILGGWLDKAEGVVFENWEFGEFNPDGLQTSCGMDFGYSVDPDTLTEVAIDKKKKIIYLKELLYKNGLGTDTLAQIVLSKIGNKLVIADSAEPRLIADLKSKGINIIAVKKGTIESGITIMQGFKIVLHPDSTNIAREFNNHVYADKGSKLYVDDFNHAIDGSRYNIIYHLDNPNRGIYDLR
jgi:phage terminase large subunit